MLDKIRSLAGSGLTSWHVLGDFVKRRIAPLKQRPCPAWNFTGLNEGKAEVIRIVGSGSLARPGIKLH